MSLQLKESNLYARGTVDEYPDGTLELNRPDINYEPQPSDRLYRVMPTDTLPRIAHEQYQGQVRDPHEYWHVLSQANGIENPLDLSELVGEDMIVPDVIEWKLRFG